MNGEGRRRARRTGAVALALLCGTGAAALVLAYHYHLGLAATLVAILGGLPGLYLTWSAYRDDRRDADRDARLSLPEVGDELARATQALTGPPTGRPLAEVTDPFALEVHRPVEPDSPEPGLTVLPLYVAREHDSELGQVVVAAAEGRSGIAVLVGGSSTGKTRACWEALRLLRDEEPGWRLWHPINPSRPDAALRELSAIGPRTVVWLNEAQFYLDAPGGLGEQVAAGLRELLRDPSCGPVLVLATIWLEFWDALTSRPQGGADLHAQARELLVGHDIAVPAAFTGRQLRRLSEVGDVRLAQAANGAQDGQVIQFLAGAPVLQARYRNAPPAAAALIHAAMDARRLGMRPALPHAFLEAAAPGYLTDSEWNQLADDWLEQALTYTAAPCKGIRGPLTRMRLRPTAGTGDSPTICDSESTYWLADYLDQQGRATRCDQIPPAAFWTAAASHAHPGDLGALGYAAYRHGLYRAAARLHKRGTANGDTTAAALLVSNMHSLHPLDQRPARWGVIHASIDDPYAVASLLRALREAGARGQAAALASRAAAQAPLGNPYAVIQLLDELHEAGAGEQVSVLAARAAAHAALDNPSAVASLSLRLQNVDGGEQVSVLATRAAAHAAHILSHIPLNDPYAVGSWLLGLAVAGAGDQLATLLARDPAAHAPLDDPRAVALLLLGLGLAGAEDQVSVLASRTAAHAPLDDPSAVASLLRELRKADAGAQIAELLARKPAAHAPLDDPSAVASLLGALGEAGAGDQVSVLASRAAAHAPLDDPSAVASLLGALGEAGAADQVAELLARKPAAHAPLDDPSAVASLLGALGEAGAADQVAELLARDPAAHVPLDGHPIAVASLLRELRKADAGEQVTELADRASSRAALDDPSALGWLLRGLREAGAGDQVAELLARDPAARVSLDNQLAVPFLLVELREVGAQEQAEVLIERLPSAGMFQLFCTQVGHQERFRFGREANGSPAGQWGWEDLD